MKKFSQTISAVRLLVCIYALHDTAGEKSVNIEHHEQTSYETERHVVHLIGGNELIRSSMVNEEIRIIACARRLESETVY